LRVRYKTSETGKLVRQAIIYTAEDHKIDPGKVDHDAVKIIKRLESFGHEAYIVGGAVRDLLLDRSPKDFDIATDAAPGRIRKLFRNSRVIGKRFRLVHVFFAGEKIIEVSTFRARDSEGFQNLYGSMEEDAMRRDFGLNSLYFTPTRNTVIDFTDGFTDIRRRRIRPVIPLDRIFEEDPVRMIRAIKYAATTGFSLARPLKRRLKSSVELLDGVPSSRMTEEVYKILGSGYAAPILESCIRWDLLRFMVPRLAEACRSREFRKRFLGRIGELDLLLSRRDADRDVLTAYLTADYLFTATDWDPNERIAFPDGFKAIKQLIFPLSPANRHVEDALSYLLKRKRRYLRSGSITYEEDLQRAHSGVSARQEKGKKADRGDRSSGKKARGRGHNRRRQPATAGEHTFQTEAAAANGRARNPQHAKGEADSGDRTNPSKDSRHPQGAGSKNTSRRRGKRGGRQGKNQRSGEDSPGTSRKGTRHPAHAREGRDVDS